MNGYELAEQYASQLKNQFPDVRISGVGVSQFDDTSYWVYVDYPEDSRARMRIREEAAELSANFLDEHHVLITPVSGVAPQAPAQT